MRNHFHLVVETPEPNLVAGMRWFLSTYTTRLNRRHQLFGHVFSGRYKALIVDGSGDGYLKTVCDYVHLNPVRASLLAPDEPLSAYPWSSFPWYGSARAHRPAWLRVDRLLAEHRIAQDDAEGRRQFALQIERLRGAEPDEAALRAVRRGWCLGSETFRQELLGRIESGLGEHHFGDERRESAEARAARIVQEELTRLRWTETELAARRKSDPAKLVIGARLRRETTLTIKQIAERLHLGTSHSANATLHRWMKNNPPPPSSANEATVGI